MKWMQCLQIGVKGLVYVKYNEDGIFKFFVDKFFFVEDFKVWVDKMGVKFGDLMFVLAGEIDKICKQFNEFCLEMGCCFGLMKEGDFKLFWVVDFFFLEWDEEIECFYVMYYFFIFLKKEDVVCMLDGDYEIMKALCVDVYDLVINGLEIGGGFICIYDWKLQECNFKFFGFIDEEVEVQFGFFMGAFEYGVFFYGGIVFGFDCLCVVMNGQSFIWDFIVFFKNNMGCDMMIDVFVLVYIEQFDELYLV